MDNQKDAIELLKQMNVTTIDSEVHTFDDHDEFMNNPLHTVIYEILYDELAAPILYHLNEEFGNGSIQFKRFKTYSSSKFIDLEFSNPDVTFSSVMNGIEIAKQIQKLHKIEKRAASV